MLRGKPEAVAGLYALPANFDC